MSKVKQATTFRDGPSLPACETACVAGFDCMHHFGLLLVGRGPSSARLGPKWVRLHRMRAQWGHGWVGLGGGLALVG